MDKEYGVRWRQFDRKDRLMNKEKIFDSQKKLDSFVKKLEQSDGFYEITSWLSPSLDEKTACTNKVIAEELLKVAKELTGFLGDEADWVNIFIISKQGVESSRYDYELSLGDLPSDVQDKIKDKIAKTPSFNPKELVLNVKYKINDGDDKVEHPELVEMTIDFGNTIEKLNSVELKDISREVGRDIDKFIKGQEHYNRSEAQFDKRHGLD